MKKILIALLFITISALYVPGIGQSSTTPLNIGDKVPDIQFSSLVNGKESLTRLSDFSGKLIILDFWGTSCVSCITAFPNLQRLQNKFGDRIQIIRISREDDLQKVTATLQRIPAVRDLTLPMVIGDKCFTSYLPYQIVPHIVWIDPSRRLAAITDMDYVNEKNIQVVLSGQAITWPVKKDLMEYDPDRPLIEFPQINIVKPPFLFYSVFSGYMTGVSLASGRRIDSVNKVALISFNNMRLLALTKIALDFRAGAKLNQFVLEVSDSSKFIKGPDEYETEWNKKNEYCYTATMPMDIPEKEAEDIIKKDLTHWIRILGYDIRKERCTYVIDGIKVEKEMYIISEIKKQ